MEPGTDFPGNTSSSSRKLEAASGSHPPIQNHKECVTRPAPPRRSRLGNEYNSICKTHKKLVKSGAVTCSVTLSDSPPELDLPSAPVSPISFPPISFLEGSTHFGAVGDFSGVQTPEVSQDPVLPVVPQPAVRGVSVIKSVPAALPSHPPPNVTPTSSRTGVIPRRISSTDPQLLDLTATWTAFQRSDTFLNTEVFRPDTSSSESSKEDNTNIMDRQSQCEQQAYLLKQKERRVTRSINEFGEDDLATSRINVMEADLSRIRDMKDEYQDAIELFLDRFEDLIGSEVISNWQKEISDIGEVVKSHADKIRTRAAQITAAATSSTRSLDVQEIASQVQEMSLNNTRQQQVEKNTRDLLAAEAEANILMGECSLLGDMMGLETDWEEADDDSVSTGMRSLSKWQEQMNTIERAFRKFENVSDKLSSDRVEAFKQVFDEAKDKFQTARSVLRKEDADRGLYTLEPSRSDIIKYPSFSGLPSEDFLKFVETMKQRFRENKVRKKEQVAKLRECLKGAALGRVPDGITDIEEAFKRLSEAFGNPSKVMNHTLKALEDLGSLPPEKLPNGHYNYAKQIEWYLKLEVILGKIIDLSGRNSKLAHEAFSSSTYKKLWARFPTSHIQKLVKVQGEDGERMSGILDKIVKMREQAQVLDDECGSTSSGAKRKTDPPVKGTVDLYFKQPRRFEECRICVHLSATGRGASDLFENHLSNYPTGCPKFMEANTEARKTLVSKIKICPQCFHPDVISNPAHLKTCPFNSKENKFSCKEENCKFHMWICLLHKTKNKEAMEHMRQELQRRGHSLTFTSYLPLRDGQTSCNTVDLHKAVRKVERLEKKKGRTVIPVPSGEPLFLFYDVKGKNKEVKTFFDNGCSHAVFKEGIPGGQLRGQLVAKGPFNIGGVGGLCTTALDEWIVSVPRTDGDTQLIQGLTVPRVTSDFPLINLTAAVKEIKDDDPENQALQNCSVPAEAGGSVDMLIGIKYLSIFPKEVHTLPSGLTIYKSKLASHGGKFDSCIGGPHSSFTALASLAGVAAQLLGHFIDGLKVYRQFGPPSIKSIAMTEEEMMLAQEYNSKEGGMPELSLWFDEQQTGTDWSSEVDCCQHCLVDQDQSCQLAHDDKISEYKRFQEMQELGLDIEYRCPDCRDCIKCKKADKTEKISLREESEDFEVKKSITLDFEQKRILAKLPLRGKERDFLSNNREKARKILIQQCKKYYGDSETKETVLKAFAKLFDNGHAVLLSDLNEEQLNKFINKEVQHHISWRVVFSSSPTTPCRPVLDASSRTNYRGDNSGGRCLNDLVCKGKVETLNILKVMVRFRVGEFAITGDLQQFYNACKLSAEQWNLQRFLWLEDLNPEGKILEAVITTLIYGVKSVSAQSEFALSQLADHIREEKPELAKFLVLSRYVDDLMESKSTKQECLELARDADELFEKVGLKCKGWNFSGESPAPLVSKDGLLVGAGGFKWFPEGDFLELLIPGLHFGKARRGRLADTVKVFDLEKDDMNSFVPEKLSRRQVSSKLASLWDLLGHLAPIMNGLKLDLRDVFQNTETWDEAMPMDLRQKWVQNFLVFEQLRGMKFERAVMPADAINGKLRLLTGVDAAKQGLMMGTWGGFKLKSGSWSNQLILGRALLARNDSIPKSELEAMCGGSNMAWVLRLALQDWVELSILFSDSTIALCWLTSEKLRLSLFHRNRVVQIRRGTELDNVYHVRTEYNPADCGTRPSKVTVADLGPGSRWECGDSWMQMDIDKAVAEGYIKPATDLRISDEFEDKFKEGLMFGEQEDILTRGHAAAVKRDRVDKLEERAMVANYLILPTKFKFPTLVRIHGYVLTFVTNARKGRKLLGELLREAKLWFSTFSSDMTRSSAKIRVFTILEEEAIPRQTDVLRKFTVKKFLLSDTGETPARCLLSNESIHLALLYLYRKGTIETKHFTNKKVLEKIAYETDGILLSKGRLLDGMNFSETGEFGDFNLGSLGVKVNIPVLERYSPLSYSIAQHVHWDVGRHRGIETTNRLSLEQVSIIQSMTLYREIASECIRCHMKRKKMTEVPMGPAAEEQLVVAPPFFITMVDLFGPLRSFVPGHERATRARRELESKLYVMVSVCITTKVVNLQALEGKDAPAIIDGFTRLSSEVGVPTMVHVDLDSGAMAGFRTAELDILDLQHKLHTQFGISFTTCPKAGHHQHGLVEAIIKSMQETFEECGLKKKRIHALGWQTFCKLAENAFNNLPIGYSFARDQDNTELLKILTPNMLRVGRINSRALQGPIRLPVDKKEMLEIVETTYEGWFKIFKETVVPKLINQPKWFKVDRDLKEKDLVYFKKKDSPISSSWKIGQIDQVIASRDGLIRRVVIKYYNDKEDQPQFTDRAVRSVVKLWSIDEACIIDDLGELRRRLEKGNDDDQAEAEQARGEGMSKQTVTKRLLASDVKLTGHLSVCGEVKCSGVVAVSQEVSVGLVTLDGHGLDARDLTTACEVDSLLVQQEMDEDEDLLGHEHEGANQTLRLESLHDVMTSTGFYLD